MFLIRCLLALATVLTLAATSAALAAPASRLHIDVYNPGDRALFAVSSEVVSGPTEVILIDAQMRRTDAEVLVGKIKATGKRLKAIYVSQGDPDFYFGLETLLAAFPNVPVFATPQTVAEIDATKAGKLAYWGPRLKADAPMAVVTPEPLKGDTLTVDGVPLRVIGLQGPTSDRTFLWIPSERTVLGGTIVAANEHVFIADTQSPRSRTDWRTTLARIEALKPAVVVPGHYHLNPDGSVPRSLASIGFTRGYLDVFETEATESANSAALIARMNARYPGLAQEPVLAISAKVTKGETKWPAE